MTGSASIQIARTDDGKIVDGGRETFVTLTDCRTIVGPISALHPSPPGRVTPARQ